MITKFKWQRFDEESKLMYCTVCAKPDESKFVNPSRAINHWNKLAKRKRRPFQHPYRAREPTGIIMEDVESSESDDKSSDDVYQTTYSDSDEVVELME